MNKKLFFAILLSGALGAQTFSNTTLTAIPDNSTAGVTSSIPVSLVETISDPSKVSVKLALTHTWSGDVTVGLVVPGGATTGAIALIKRVGSTTATGVGSSANFGSANVLTFNSAATAPISTVGLLTGDNIPAGTYLPSVSATTNPADYTVANLSTLFTGLAVNGTWSLKLFDSVASDTGSLNNWQVVFDPGTFLGVNTSIVSTPGLSVLGNPFKETLNLKVNTSAKDVKFDIYSMDGKKVYSYNQNASKNSSGDLKIPTESWTSGMYILTPIVNGERLMTIKLIKK
ncbi:proprotein convertase P-domain-containing protein [Chryseobacterium sp. KACC 21268]|nr:proprotein convertase P-domain-containing protein [Chryseobacterium sp. KACC 21268]